LAGGLTQLIHKVVSRSNLGERRIFTGSQVFSAMYDQNHFIIKTKTRTFRSLNTIFAIPKHGLEKLDIFKPIYKDLDYIGSIADTHTVWTYVGSDEGTYLLSGVHLFNRIGYLVSKEKYRFLYEVKIDGTNE
jgi:hypothetical protein